MPRMPRRGPILVSGLSWYAVAQHYYPASSIANDGLARVSKSILYPKGS